jgi:hypothetical protein
MITLWLSSYLLVHLDAVENSLVGDIGDYSVVEFLFVGSFDVVGCSTFVVYRMIFWIRKISHMVFETVPSSVS